MNNRWAELAILATSRAAMGAQFQVVGALGPLLIVAPATAGLAIGTTRVSWITHTSAGRTMGTRPSDGSRTGSRPRMLASSGKLLSTVHE